MPWFPSQQKCPFPIFSENVYYKRARFLSHFIIKMTQLYGFWSARVKNHGGAKGQHFFLSAVRIQKQPRTLLWKEFGWSQPALVHFKLCNYEINPLSTVCIIDFINVKNIQWQLITIQWIHWRYFIKVLILKQSDSEIKIIPSKSWLSK